MVMNSLPEPGAPADEEATACPQSPPPPGADQVRNRPATELDPGWILVREIEGKSREPLVSISGLSWWIAPLSSPSAEALQRLWRHSVATSLAARWLAREANDPSPDRVASAGLLHNLGLWAVTAIDAEWLVRWLDESDSSQRLQREHAELGEPITELGQRLASRWRCPSLIADAAWLHSPRDASLRQAANNPDRLKLIQEAVRWANMTPWSIAPIQEGHGAPDWDHPSADPRLRILVAEVQSRCTTPFVAPDATAHEERMTRQNARLRLQLAEAKEYRESCDRFLNALSASDPAERPESWALTAETLCAEPSVTAARVVLSDPEVVIGSSKTSGEATTTPVDAPVTVKPPHSIPGLILPLGGGCRPLAEIQLWFDPDRKTQPTMAPGTPLVRAWEAWIARVVDRAALDRRFHHVLQAFRKATIDEEVRIRQLKLDALAEFAAGAGHEINNPLAVIVGRSQLLLARTQDAEQARSLRIILGQAQRAHRILRDLMFFARPPAPRLRPCRPGELLRACVADFREESEARGVALTSEIDDPTVEIHADADALRHLAEILIRNAIQATPAGGAVHARADAGRQETRWTITDSGPGVNASEAAHLFDPFYSGRQAGRGLGLGLPRAARIVSLAGGQIHWSASPGHGTSFRVHLPRNPVPRLATAESPSDQPASLPAIGRFSESSK
jgi:signal transduction histidine kinase